MPEITDSSGRLGKRYANGDERNDLILEIERKAFHSILALLRKPCLSPGMGSRGLARASDIPGKIGRGRNFPKMPRARKVTAIFTLCLTPSPVSLLNECHRLLHCQGKILVGFIPRESPWGRFCAQSQKRGRPINRLARPYPLKKVEHMMMAAGFSIQGYFSSLFQKPASVRELENPMRGYHPHAGFLVILGERRD